MLLYFAILLGGITATMGQQCYRHSAGRTLSNLEAFQGEVVEVERAVECPLLCSARGRVLCRAVLLHSLPNGTRNCAVLSGPQFLANDITRPPTLQPGETFSVWELIERCFPNEEWLAWGQWSACTATCGVVPRVRSRECQYTGPPEEERSCFGRSTDSEPCPDLDECPIDLGLWSEWSSCAATCGTSFSSRFRTCARASGCFENGILAILGEDRACGPQVCPGWSEWQPWSSCRSFRGCGSGNRFRGRFCAGTIGLDCPGDQTQEEICDLGACGGWAAWGSWGECASSCGVAVQSRSRFCPLGTDCSGSGEQRRVCEGLPPCGGQQRYGEWLGFGACSITCGVGERRRLRICLPGESCGDAELVESELCSAGSCEGSVSAWAVWSSCSIRCGSGTRSRGRICTEGTCSLPLAESEPCTGDNCAVFEQWGAWGSCTVSCSIGFRQRTRGCVGEGVCEGRSSESEECNEGPCPGWGSWQQWTSCSLSCASGSRKRTRLCRAGSSLRVPEDCEGGGEESVPCNEFTCPKWAEWLEWGACSRSCGNGIQSRLRQCVGGVCDGEGQDQRPCTEGLCPIWARWADWGDCSVSCGIGFQSRVRVCDGGPVCAGLSTETTACSAGTCPSWGTWEGWGRCTSSCGGGTRIRRRFCQVGFGRGRPEECPGGDADEEGICGTQGCPGWREWGAWSLCQASCGFGTRVRTRECSGQCEGEGGERDVVECEAGRCPEWERWAEWGGCSVTCGTGLHSRRRVCRSPGSDEVQLCDGVSTDVSFCEAGVCPTWRRWGEWSSCSVDCGIGIWTRTRTCSSSEPDVCGKLEGGKEESVECDAGVCAQWAAWEAWSFCSASCGTATKTRVRICVGNGGCPKDDPSTDETVCELDTCAMWSRWAEWSSCSVSCGAGVRSRGRVCDGDDCPGQSLEEIPCQAGPCSEWGDWGQWESCSISCGIGFTRRTRVCEGGLNCPGDTVEISACDEEVCAPETSWGPWGRWSECESSCGSSIERRRRECLGAAGLLSCEGTGEESRPCDTGVRSCAHWSAWTPWGACQISCGEGRRERFRECVGGRAGDCVGDNADIGECNPPDPVCGVKSGQWESWSPWSTCSTGCGSGRSVRVRRCIGSKCPGSSIDEKTCSADGGCPRPVAPPPEPSCGRGGCGEEEVWPQWSGWGGWGECSSSCGSGERQRRRVCNGGRGSECRGRFVQSEACLTSPCPGANFFGRFQAPRKFGLKAAVAVAGLELSWSECSVTCGVGRKTRRSAKCAGVEPCEEPVEVMRCDVGPCAQWGSWTPWGECSASCGSATAHRSRECEGFGCEGKAYESRRCSHLLPCPTQTLSLTVGTEDEDLSSWSKWSKCYGTCGWGTQFRKRKCVDSGACRSAKDFDYRRCKLPACSKSERNQ